MIEVLARGGDIIGALTFGVALAVLLATPSDRDGAFTPSVKWMLVGAVAIFFYLTGMDALGWTHLSTLGEEFEDHVQALEPLLALGAAFALYSTQQYRDAERAQRALGRSNELMMQVVDQAPAGILMLDPSGRIVFANDRAKHLLDLEEGDDGSIRGPGWRARGAGPSQTDSLAVLVDERSFSGRGVRLDWPNGWFVDMLASGQPLLDGHDRLGGVVVTFEPVT